ncbi:phosphopantetheine-binding protein [Streptomyces sp. WAC06614]|uniref:phosphopantetheine-binding protein n=1 Tax=Streptomyces sp. WAC06614 TaxID=2487416 RepID=UPI000F79FC53|nr:phosphopantetheine-binding protein [Streptomyces sp. WAC06614]RSS75599.1 hypothetical protein EF918_23795 [Streptomyces sp. WAC06614]
MTTGADAARAAAAAGAPAGAPAGTVVAVREEVRALWAVVLKVAPPAPQSGFFELGGDVLAAHRMLRQLSRTYGLDLGLRQIYETPTLEGLVAAIARRLE